MKKIIITFFSVIMCILFAITSLAVSTPSIGAETTKIVKDNITLIPVELKNNTGIMGCKISVTYPVDVIKIVSVSRGSLTKTGNFNTNLGIQEGVFDVLWNETKNITNDGSIFVIGVKALDYFDKKTIKLSYSVDDTFDENWKDVKLVCQDIAVSCRKNEQTNSETTANLDTHIDNKNVANSIIQPTDDQLIDAMKTTLEQYKVNSVDDIDNEKKIDFIDSLNKNINTLTGGTDSWFHSFKEAKRNYNNSVENDYIQKNLSAADEKDIKAAIESALKSMNVDSINNIDQKHIKKFIKKVNDNLHSLNENIPDITENMDEDTAMTTIKKLYGSLKLVEPSDNYTPPKNNYLPLICCCSIIAIVSCTIVIIAFIKKKKRGAK